VKSVTAAATVQHRAAGWYVLERVGSRVLASPDCSCGGKTLPRGEEPVPFVDVRFWMNDAPCRTKESKMLKTILVPTDGSNVSRRANAYALDLAERLGARVIFVQAVDLLQLPSAEARAENDVMTQEPEDWLCPMPGRAG
jgi:Universal stress protein family